MLKNETGLQCGLSTDATACTASKLIWSVPMLCVLLAFECSTKSRIRFLDIFAYLAKLVVKKSTAFWNRNRDDEILFGIILYNFFSLDLLSKRQRQISCWHLEINW